jgi:hypothetical protein
LSEFETQGRPEGLSDEDFHALLDDQLAVFKSGEKYSYVKDLLSAYDESLKTSLEDKIIDTIPEHVFFDIKKSKIQN